MASIKARAILAKDEAEARAKFSKQRPGAVVTSAKPNNDNVHPRRGPMPPHLAAKGLSWWTVVGKPASPKVVSKRRAELLLKKHGGYHSDVLRKRFPQSKMEPGEVMYVRQVWHHLRMMNLEYGWPVSSFRSALRYIARGFREDAGLDPGLALSEAVDWQKARPIGRPRGEGTWDAKGLKRGLVAFVTHRPGGVKPYHWGVRFSGPSTSNTWRPTPGMNFPLKGGAEKTLESAQKAVEAYLKDYYRKKESVGEATEKVKVKRGMGGTGGGRWTTRANAKKASKKRRRKEDKRAAKIREAFFPLAERAGSEAVAVTFSLSEGPRGKDEFTAEWDGGKAQSRTIDDLLARLTRPMMNHRLSPVDNRTFGIQDTKVKAIRVFLRSQKAYSGKVWLLPRKRKPQAPPGFRYEKG